MPHLDSLEIIYHEVYDSPSTIDSVLINSKINDKPILLVFNSVACVNCRRFESEILFKPEVINVIRSNFEVVNLFTDIQKKVLISKKDLMKLNKYDSLFFSVNDSVTLGHVNSAFQIELLQSGWQPQVCILNSDGTLRNKYNGPIESSLVFLKWVAESKEQ